MRKINVKLYKDRPDLKGEHPFGKIGQLIILIIFFLILIVEIFILKLSGPKYLNMPLWLNIPLGTFILFLGFYCIWKSKKVISRVKCDRPMIIRDKIYRKVRHPMYLSAMLVYMGITIITFSFVLFIVFRVIFIFYNIIARYEEKFLLNQFGDSYADYMHKVRCWIPQLF